MDSVQVKELKLIVERLQALYQAAGATGPANDLRRLASLFEGYEAETIDAFISSTKALLEDQAAAPKKAPAKARPVDTELISAHSKKLLAAGTDERLFDLAYNELLLDKGVKEQEMYAIANAYANGPTGSDHVYKFSSKANAQRGIRDVFIERFEAESKCKNINRMMQRS